MTDEEKAEKYADKILSDSKYPFILNKQKVKAYIIKVYLDSLKCCEEAYNKGFADGRKKEADLIFESWCKGSDDEQCECGFLKKLEKENEELEKIRSGQAKIMESDLNRIEKIKKENENLKAQIEKMTCCGNCKYDGSSDAIGENGDYIDYTCIQCDDLSSKENPYPNWELSE